MRSRRGRANSPVRFLSYSRSRYARSRNTTRQIDATRALRHRK